MAFASLIGATVKRKEDPRLITGRGTFVGNLKLAGMLHVAFVRSQYAHADICGIDSAAALNMPGVVAVVTGQDLAEDYNPMLGIGSDEVSRRRTRYALSVDRVRYTGEPVAAVIATSPEIAEDASSAVWVEMDPLPVVASLEQATAEGAPRLFDGTENNIPHVFRRKRGQVDEAFAGAYRIVQGRLGSQRLAGVPMEGRAVVAAPDPATGGVTVWSSTQAAHQTRSELAKVLRWQENQIRVITPDVGGGFGVKIGIYPEDVVLALLAQKYGVPLRWVESRLENILTTSHGRAQVAEVEAAVEQDGTVSALRLRGLADIGAYPKLDWIPDLTGLMAVGVYRIPAVDLEISCVLTNTTHVAAYRGAGRPEAAYYIERLMDLVAAELELDPVAVRRKNFIPPDQFPYQAPTGRLYDSGEYDRALTKALELAGYSELRAEQARRRAENSDHLLGIGLACYVEMCAFGPYESAVVRVDPTGTVTVFTGISPHGQGQHTSFAQIVADTIGVDFDNILVRHGDTGTMPMGNGTMGSRGLVVGGSAVLQAAGQVRTKAQLIAAHMLEAAPEDIVLEQGRYQVKGVPDRGLKLAEIAKRAYTDDLPDDITSGLEATEFWRPAEMVYPFGAHVAVVEIERETGIVHLRNYVSVDDCGKRISPLLVEGQVHGGLAQGIAQALLEEVVYDDTGQLLTGTLMDYAVPRADSFSQFVTGATETPTPLNPLGAKGIGEAATIGSTPAVVNAVLDALRPFGVRHIDSPLRPEKIWRALNGNP